MSRSQYTILMIMSLLIACQLSAAADRNHRSPRKLLQIGRSSNGDNTAINTLRAQAVTSQAIEEAVNSGANGYATRRAGAVGSTIAWAASQNDQQTFNTAERFVSPYGK